MILMASALKDLLSCGGTAASCVKYAGRQLMNYCSTAQLHPPNQRILANTWMGTCIPKAGMLPGLTALDATLGMALH